MAETEAKKQRRQPTKLTIKSRPADEVHPRQWGETVKVPKAELDALVEEYKRLHDENWKYDIAAKRTAKSNMSRQFRLLVCSLHVLSAKPCFLGVVPLPGVYLVP